MRKDYGDSMKKSEYANFEDAMKKLMKVSHGEIKEKLDAEKEQKSAKKKEKKAEA